MKSWTQEPVKQILDNIDRDDHEERIIYLEEHAAELLALDEYDRCYCTYQYVHSLHAVQRYEDLLRYIDEVIEFVFIHDIDFIPTRTYERLLCIKTEALYETLQYEESVDISKQLLGMHPEDKRYRKLLEKSYRSLYNMKSGYVRLAAMILIFSSSIVSAIFWLSTRSQVQASPSYIFLIIITPCFLAMTLMALSHFYYYLKSIQQTDKLIRTKRTKRA